MDYYKSWILIGFSNVEFLASPRFKFSGSFDSFSEVFDMLFSFDRAFNNKKTNW